MEIPATPSSSRARVTSSARKPTRVPLSGVGTRRPGPARIDSLAGLSGCAPWRRRRLEKALESAPGGNRGMAPSTLPGSRRPDETPRQAVARRSGVARKRMMSSPSPE